MEKTLPFAIAVVIFMGCGQSGPRRVDVSGNVTLNGQPLAEGSIRLVPFDGGLTAGSAIEDGRFHIAKHEGPVAGEYRVEIVSFQPTGRQISDPDFPGQMRQERRQIIPARYNRDSTLSTAVPDSGSHCEDFVLETP